jgi:glycerophosphoryl diester phosphodiesterase
MKQYTIGHRGAAGVAPENALKAFRIGCESPAEVLECDIHLTKDKKLVVIHDGTLDRTTNGSGWVKDYTLEEIRRFDAGDGEKIPTLEEVVELVLDHGKKLIIEIKAEDWPTALDQADAFSTFLQSHTDIIPKIYLHSFWLDILGKVKQNFPDLSTFAVIWVGLSPDKLVQLIIDAKANGVSIEQDYVSAEFVDLCHQRNIEINAFLLNDASSFEKMRNRRVDGLITNYPDKFHL